MKTTANVFSKIKADLSDIGLIRDKSFPRYFCTPLNAVIFANLGVDGIHFCIIPAENDRALEHSPIYIVSPMMPDHYVEAVAENFNDFISLVVSAKDAGLLECISYLNREKFLEEIHSIPSDSLGIENALSALSDTFPTKNIDDIYGFVQQIHAKMGAVKVLYSEEYYEIMGQSE